MATKEKDTNKELEVEEIVSKSEQFIENNSKKIIYGIIAVALVVGAVLGIKHGYLVPQEKKAAAAMFKGEQYFARDSFALALNGNGADYEGFEAIIDQYGSKLGKGLRRYLLLQDGRYTEGARFIEIFQRKGPNGISGGYRLDR